MASSVACSERHGQQRRLRKFGLWVVWETTGVKEGDLVKRKNGDDTSHKSLDWNPHEWEGVVGIGDRIARD